MLPSSTVKPLQMAQKAAAIWTSIRLKGHMSLRYSATSTVYQRLRQTLTPLTLPSESNLLHPQEVGHSVLCSPQFQTLNAALLWPVLLQQWNKPSLSISSEFHCISSLNSWCIYSTCVPLDESLHSMLGRAALLDESPGSDGHHPTTMARCSC